MRHGFDPHTLAPRGCAANLSTQLGVKGLPPVAQAEFPERVKCRVDAHGGAVTVHHLAVLTVSKRAM